MQVRNGIANAVGHTPLIRLRHLSEQTGCEILGKAEFLNPGGSVKDRAALYIIRDAERSGELRPGGTIVEGTAGNTGIGLALIGNALGYRTIIVIPETQSQEKMDLLRICGAEVRPVPAVPYRDPNNYVKVSGRLAQETGAFWANQFDNIANRQGHYESTGPEIWEQTDGLVDAFVAATGTGGTLGGVGRCLKERKATVRTILADPMGSGLYNFVKTGEVRAEGNSVTEGIGNGRVTANLEGTDIDDAVRIDDDTALSAMFALVRDEGLYLGGSTGINVAAAVEVARMLGPGHTVVTILCDGGDRYRSRLYNPVWLRAKHLPVPAWLG
jgi:cysteine synthase A